MAGTVQNTGKLQNLTNMGKGRKKGVPNKVTAAAKSVIAEAAEKLGGVERLVAWAKEDPENEGKFWSSIYPKLIPVQVTGEDGAPIQYEQVQNDAQSFESAIAGIAARIGAGATSGNTHH